MATIPGWDPGSDRPTGLNIEVPDLERRAAPPPPETRLPLHIPNVNRLDPGNVTTVPVVVTTNHSAHAFGREEK